MGDWPNGNMPPLPTIHPWSEESLGMLYGTTGVPGGTIYAQNRLYLWPFTITQHRTAKKMFVLNGGTVNGNVDVGIYDADFRLLVSSGSTAQAGASGIQEFDITDTELSPGLYYIGFAGNSATGTVYGLIPSDELGLVVPLYSLSSSFPLTDNPAVVVSDSTTPAILVVGIAFDTLV